MLPGMTAMTGFCGTAIIPMTGNWADITATNANVTTSSNADVTPSSVGSPSTITVVISGGLPPTADSSGYLKIYKNSVDQGDAYNWNGSASFDNTSLSVDITAGDQIHFTGRLTNAEPSGDVIAVTVSVYDRGVFVDSFALTLTTT